MKKMSILLGILFFLGSLASIVKAGEVLTLNESIKIALDKSLSVHSAKEEVKRKEFERRSARTDFFPKLSTSYSYTRIDKDTIHDAKYITYPYNPLTDSHLPKQVSPLDQDTFDLNLTAIQPLFTGWSLTTAHKLASLGVDIAKIQKESVIQNLVLNVKTAYFGILKADNLEDVARQAVEQLEAHLKVSQAFYDEGVISKNKLLETEVWLAQARQNLIRATRSAEIVRSRFNNLLRRGLDQRVEIEDILDYHPITLTLSQCMERAELNRPEVKEASLSIASAEKAVKLGRSSYYPSINLIGNYERKTDEANLDPDPGEDPDNWTVTAEARWTFWEWGKTHYNVSAAKVNVVKAKDLLMEIKDGINLEVKDAYLYLREAEKNIQVAKTAVAQAQENFRMNEEMYKQQVATSTDVLDAQTLLTQAQTNHFNALSEYNIAVARLERAMGEDMQK
ncbi:MAG: TolC family protein [Thermodesulfobacteriota bacterium]|nr:TolC family protein [Thermodesulfobacteriota bacterium]